MFFHFAEALCVTCIKSKAEFYLKIFYLSSDINKLRALCGFLISGLLPASKLCEIFLEV